MTQFCVKFQKANFYPFLDPFFPLFWENDILKFGHPRKFMSAKCLNIGHPRKFMSAKCKDFAVRPNRETFCPRKFLPLKYIEIGCNPYGLRQVPSAVDCPSSTRTYFMDGPYFWCNFFFVLRSLRRFFLPIGG